MRCGGNPAPGRALAVRGLWMVLSNEGMTPPPARARAVLGRASEGKNVCVDPVFHHPRSQTGPPIITHVTEKGTSVSRASFVRVLGVMNLRGGLRDYVESS